MKKVKHKHAKYVGYKDAIKNINDVEDFHEAMKKGDLTVLARHPETGILTNFKITNITEDGRVQGYFYDNIN